MTNKKDDIRLNAPKRKALKDAWRDVVLKRTPTEKEDVLRKAVADFKELETSVWDSVRMGQRCLSRRGKKLSAR